VALKRGGLCTSAAHGKQTAVVASTQLFSDLKKMPSPSKSAWHGIVGRHIRCDTLLRQKSWWHAEVLDQNTLAAPWLHASTAVFQAARSCSTRPQCAGPLLPYRPLHSPSSIGHYWGVPSWHWLCCSKCQQGSSMTDCQAERCCCQCM
jgi:hypothetical protein